jgi:hypothetical protein
MRGMTDLAAAFPKGASFWGGDPVSKLAEDTWQSQRASLTADYKRKRRDALRQLPKRSRR